MAQRCLFSTFILFVMLAMPSLAYAEPRCGDVDNGVVDDTWDVADNIRFYRDYRSPIRSVCEAMEALEDYQKKNTLTKAENDVLDDRAELLEENVERQLQDMHDDLKAIELWLRADADSDRQRMRRLVNIKDARHRVQQMSGNLDGSRREALALIKP